MSGRDASQRQYEQLLRHPGGRLLVSAVLELGRPTSPPDRSTREGLGLHLLRSTVSLDHVDRVSESLELVDATHMARHLDLDVDLGRIRHRLPSLRTEPWRSTHGARDVWVPVGRHPRGAVGPVVPLDGDGSVVPRMSSRETNRIVASGLISILRALDGTRPPARPPSTMDVRDQWLVETAILALVQDGRRHWRAPDPRLDRALDEARLRDADRSRSGAVALLAVSEPFLAFLDVLHAMTVDQVLVVRLDSHQHQHRVTYTAPELESRRRPLVGPGVPTPPLLNGRQFTVEYTTTIPAHVESYHLTIEVPSEIEIRGMLLSSDADHAPVTAVREDLERIAHRGAAGSDELSEEMARFEARSAWAKLDELILRRREDLTEYRDYVARIDRRLTRTQRFLLSPWRSRSRRRVMSVVDRLERLIRGGLPLDRRRERTDDGAEERRRRDLDSAAALIERNELHRDLHVDRDARDSAGHVLWRRHGAGLGLASGNAVRAKAFVTLVDARPSAALRSFGVLFLNALLVTGLLSAFAVIPLAREALGERGADDVLAVAREAGDPGFWREVLGGIEWSEDFLTTPTRQSDVVVTLLLLVLGLIVRTDRTPSRSVLARLRAVPSMLGWLAVAVNALIAIVIVAWPSQPAQPADEPVNDLPVLVAASLVAVLGLLTVVSLVHVLSGVDQWLPFAPRYVSVPRWLGGHRGWRRRLPRLRPSVTFDAEEPAGAAGSGVLGISAAARTLIEQAARVIEQPIVHVEVTHAHRPDAVPPERKVAARDVTSGGFAASEVLVADVDGLTHTLVTRRQSYGYTQDNPDTRPSVEVTRHTHPRRGLTTWSGVARTVPGFSREALDKLDLILTLAPGQWQQSGADAAAVVGIVGRVTSTAAGLGLPVTVIRAPAAGFRNNATESGTGDPFLARGRNVRLTVGLPPGSSAARRTLLSLVDDIAAAGPYGLHVADRGFGALSGRWIQVRPLPSLGMVDPEPVVAPRAARLLTVLGPYRRGSFAAIAAALAQATVPVHAMTCAAQQELDVMHAVVGVAARSGPAAVRQRLPRPVAPAQAPLGELLARHWAPGTDVRSEIVADYYAMVSPVLRLPRPLDDQGHALWATWTLRDIPPDRAMPTRSAIVERLIEVVSEHRLVAPGGVQVEHHRMRRHTETTRVERVELAVILVPQAPDRHDPGAVPERLNTLAEDVRRTLEAWQPGADRGRLVRPRVAAREGWLGAWTDDPS